MQTGIQTDRQTGCFNGVSAASGRCSDLRLLFQAELIPVGHALLIPAAPSLRHIQLKSPRQPLQHEPNVSLPILHPAEATILLRLALADVNCHLCVSGGAAACGEFP